MSEFISGNAGIIKKEDIVFLEILEPNPFFLKDEYKIYATTYTLDKGELDILPMPKGRGFLDTNDICPLK